MLIERDDPRHDPNNARSFMHPSVVHLCGYHVQRRPYPTQALKLDLAISRGWRHWLTPAHALFARTLPASAIQFAKDLFRPMYGMLFGYRPMVDERL